MEQQNQTATAPRQNRMAREMESRAATMRPQAWRAPETLPSPDERPGWKHRWVRLSTLGQADPSNISSKLREGYDIHMEDSSGPTRFMLTWGQFEAMKKCIKAIDKSHSTK